MLYVGTSCHVLCAWRLEPTLPPTPFPFPSSYYSHSPRARISELHSLLGARPLSTQLYALLAPCATHCGRARRRSVYICTTQRRTATLHTAHCLNTVPLTLTLTYSHCNTVHCTLWGCGGRWPWPRAGVQITNQEEEAIYNLTNAVKWRPAAMTAVCPARSEGRQGHIETGREGEGAQRVNGSPLSPEGELPSHIARPPLPPASPVA